MPKEDFHWVVCEGRVIASCLHPDSLVGRILPTRIVDFWTGAAILRGRLPVVAVALNRRLSVIHLDESMKVIKARNLVGVKLVIPRAKTRVLIVTSEEIGRRYQISPGDQFELKA